jgi:hypothetical protein
MLTDIESRLHENFAALADKRKRNGWPIFAIEHGLHSDEVEILKSELQADLSRTQKMSRGHFLVWVILAAEIGYSYNGDEFWQSFEQEVPAWRYWGDRLGLKRRYLRFEENYRGFRPQGRWAEHFSIISWPISHAILASALHSKFAQLLHDRRFELAARQNWTNSELGKFASDSYYGRSTLLAGLLEQHELIGNLISNLRSETQDIGDAPIQLSILQRLCRDIESARLGKSNLQGFQRVQRTTNIRVKGELGRQGGEADPLEDDNSEAYTRRYRPKLIAKIDSAGVWQLGLNLQGIAGLLAEKGIRLREMRNVRMRFIGQKRPSPIEALRSFVTQPMIEVPDLARVLSKPLITFEGEAEGLDQLQKIVVGPPIRPCWLLRVQADGLAHEVVGRHIKRDSRYLLVTHKELSTETCSVLNLSRVDCAASGPVAYSMETGDHITDVQEIELKKLGLGWIHSININPVGLVPRWEDGSDSVVFVQDECVLLRIDSDVIVDGFTIRVNRNDPVRVNTGLSRDIILELTDLDIGSHAVRIEPVGAKHSNLPSVEFFVSIRSKEHWSLFGTAAAGFSVEAFPHTFSFTDLQVGDSIINVNGLAGEECEVKVSLFNYREELIAKSSLGKIKLPNRIDANGALFKQIEDGEISDHLQDAGTVVFTFVIPDIGKVERVFDQQIEPLRWKLERREGKSIVRLIDETDEPNRPIVRRASLETPDRLETIAYGQVCDGDEITSPGYMYTLDRDVPISSRVFTIMERSKFASFSDLGVKPARFLTSRPADVTKVLAAYVLWRNAQYSGALPLHRRRQILSEIELHLFKLFLHPNWVDRMWAFASRNPSLLPNQQKHVGGSPGFASQIRSKWKIWKRCNQLAVNEFADHAVRYEITDDKRLAKCALVLAMAPQKLKWESEAIQQLLNRVGESPSLWKGAFFAKTVVACHKNARAQRAGL